MKHIISVLVENEPGALSRIVGLFAQRNYNIETLNVAPTEDETLSRVTLTTMASNSHIEQIHKQLNKLVDVVKLVELTDGSYVERELLLIKLKATGNMRDEIKLIADTFRGQLIDITQSIFTVQVVGTSEKLDAFIAAVDSSAIIEVVRSGVSGIARGERRLSI